MFIAALCVASAQVRAGEVEVEETHRALPIESVKFDDGKHCTASDVLFHNARIYTPIDSGFTSIEKAATSETRRVTPSERSLGVRDYEIASYEAVAIKDGAFVFVGSDREAEAWRCGASQAIDLEGATVFPGFTDSHQHLEGVGRRTKTLSLFGNASLKETVSQIRDWSEQIPEGGWVMGRGWIEREWRDEQRFLTRWDVDSFTESKPLYMPRADGVSALVNSKALALAGINRDTPDPEGGAVRPRCKW